ncbi:H-NS histone family protein [Hydrogenophaga sp. PAMC20947]|uniref:H-NS histone family protein n=1 Tax=Hydrogenophaga sp. PAMC20947 TaxID=2565558 RepID=UPI00109DDBED|nr:H-NS histone family protein [Hydrogenophaga sp. PAMC20947]
MSEQRYADMLKSASALFASADVDTESEKRAAIDEINELMTQHGLTVDDLR